MKRNKRTRKLVISLLVLAMFALSGAGYYAYRPMPLPTTPFEFELKRGDNLKSVARQLQQAGLLDQDWAFVWLTRLLGKSSQIKAGYYAIQRPVSPLELLEIFHKGEVIQRKLSVIEGWTFRQFRDELNANPDLMHVTASLTDAEILQRIGASETHPEGLFFPDTYRFAAGTRDLLIFKRAYQNMQHRLQSEWNKRDPDLPLQTPYQALILASIVEKETGAPSDRAMIAAVFVNRLRKGMRLQTDPTVIYGMGEAFDGNLRKRDLLADTPYNTYTRHGLPPTPIALPGQAALQAALHPARTGALYFVASGNGNSHFSSSLVEHNRAVDQFQKKIRNPVRQ
ncbi:MAG TPA: endolytic transglycosylase MltG [Gallionella sp.]